MEREVAVLKDLVRATCNSADACAAAIEGAADPYLSMLLEQVREDQRLLVVDLARCLLLRAVPETEVRRLMTELPGAGEAEAGGGGRLEGLVTAERRLETALRGVLADSRISQSTLEVLSLHYLRLQLRLKELGERGQRELPAGTVPQPQAPMLLH